MHLHVVDCEIYSKNCLKRLHKKKIKIGFQNRLSLNAGQKYCRILQGEHSAIVLSFIKLPFVKRIFGLSILSGRLRHGLLYAVLNGITSMCAIILIITLNW